MQTHKEYVSEFDAEKKRMKSEKINNEIPWITNKMKMITFTILSRTML